MRVTPRAKHNAIVGVHDGALKVTLTAPPVEGAANAALQKLIAKHFGVSKTSVQVVQGHKGRLKRIRVDGIDRSALEEMLSSFVEG